MWEILKDYFPALLRGGTVTLFLSLIAWTVGLLGGFFLGVAAYYSKVFQTILHALSFLVLSVPFIVLLYWAHFPLQEMLKIVVNPFVTAAAILCLLNSLAVAEIWLSSFKRYGQDQMLVARMSGLSNWQAVKHVQLPLSFRHALPMLIALQVAIMQLTLFSSLISVNELFRVAQRINSEIYKPIEIYSALAFLFLILSAPLYYLAFRLRVRFVQNFNTLDRS